MPMTFAYVKQERTWNVDSPIAISRYVIEDLQVQPAVQFVLPTFQCPSQIQLAYPAPPISSI